MTSLRQTASSVALCLLILLVATTASVTAQASSSASYGVDNVTFGGGGQLNACSASYCSKQTAGEMTVGNTSSTDYQAQGGNNTEREPYLEFMVNNANIDLGVLSTSTTKTASATFSVKTYLASGYVVENASLPPQNGSYTMNALATPTASSTGSEQFGINVVANSCPANSPSSGAGSCTGSLGANPVQVPDSTFSFGQAAHNSASDYYDQPNLFMYKNNDIIAYSNKSSGETDYTISYLFNISPTTAGGTFTMNHVLVATSTF